MHKFTKWIVVSMSVLLAIGTAHAAAIWSENFDGLTSIPISWKTATGSL